MRVVLEREAYDALKRFCAEKGVTFTALLEAFGEAVLEAERTGNEVDIGAAERSIGRAKQISEERRKRAKK